MDERVILRWGDKRNGVSIAKDYIYVGGRSTQSSDTR